MVMKTCFSEGKLMKHFENPPFLAAELAIHLPFYETTIAKVHYDINKSLSRAK